MSSNLVNKRVLITGATGYIGSNLVRHLRARGSDVHVIVRPKSDLRVLSTLINEIVVHEHDGTSKGMVDIVTLAKPDIVFHLASLFLAEHKTEDIDALISCNILFSTQLVEAMALNGVKYLVNTGTSWQHYNDENYNPVNLYAATKQAFEDILTYYTVAYALKVTTLLLFDTYGPNDPRSKLISLLWKTAKTQQPLMMSPGEQMIDLVHIEDVLRGFTLAEDALKTQGIGHSRYGISSGNPMRLIDLVAAFQRATSLSLPISFGGRPYRPREVMVPWTSFQPVPRWFPEVKFEEGILQTCPEKIASLDGGRSDS